MTKQKRMTKQQRYDWIWKEVQRRMMAEHLSRWTELTMKKNGDVLQVIRTGYLSTEDLYMDDCMIKRGSEVLFKGPYCECCMYINDNY